MKSQGLAKKEKNEKRGLKCLLRWIALGLAILTHVVGYAAEALDHRHLGTALNLIAATVEALIIVPQVIKRIQRRFNYITSISALASSGHSGRRRADVLNASARPASGRT